METRDRAPIITVDRRFEWAAKGGPQIRDSLAPLPMSRERRIKMLQRARAAALEAMTEYTDQLRELGVE